MLNKKILISKKVVALIQARMGSTRLKNKALVKIDGKTIVEIILERLKKCKEIDGIILSTATTKENDILADHAKKIGLKCHRGPEEDLITRHLGALEETKADAFIKITADCPLVDPGLVDKLVKKYKENSDKFDFFTNCLPPTFPDGLDLDITPLKILKRLDKEVGIKSIHRDFFIAYIMSNPDKFRIYNLKNDKNLSFMRWTLDYPEDLEFIKKIFEQFSSRKAGFATKEILEYISENPKVLDINKNRIDNVILKNIRSGAYHLAAKKERPFLILDFDGTIADLKVNWPKIRERIAKITEDLNIYPDFNLPQFLRIKKIRQDILKKIGNKLLADKIYKKCLKIIEEEEISAVDKTKLVNGAKDFVRWAHANELPFAVLSNNHSKVIRKIFNKFSLPAPKTIVGFDCVKEQKPHVEGVNKVLLITGKKAPECALVGDSLADVEIGKGAGIKTYILKRRGKKSTAQSFKANFIENFSQLKKIIKL